MRTTPNWPHAAPDGLMASLLLSFLATAGLYYVNIMPALVEGLKTGLHFTDAQAGMSGSANVYGAAAGALVATLIVTQVDWRRAAYVLLALLISIDIASIFIHSAALMIAVRACHGFFGGLLVGIAFSVIARTRRPERTFGMLLVVQDGLGGLGVMLLPQWVPLLGTPVLFMVLIAFSIITLAMIPFLDVYPRQQSNQMTNGNNLQWLPLVCAMLSVFLFQFSNMVLFAYIIGLAKYFSLQPGHAADIVGISAWIGIIGSILVIMIATRFGRARTLMIALLLTGLGMWLLHASANAVWYAVANCGTAITWSFVIPYLLGMCAKFDSSGRAAAFGGFSSKMGLATGPLVGGIMASSGHYELLINVAVVCIFVCAIVAIYPARVLDQRDRALVNVDARIA